MAYTLWQYTQRGKLKGIAGFVDFSKFNKKYNVESIKIKKKTADERQNTDSATSDKTRQGAATSDKKSQNATSSDARTKNAAGKPAVKDGKK